MQLLITWHYPIMHSRRKVLPERLGPKLYLKKNWLVLEYISKKCTTCDKNYVSYSTLLGARCWWRSWLRHCATSRKVAGSIPDDVIGIFHLHNHSGRTMDLGLIQPLTEMSTRNVSWG